MKTFFQAVQTVVVGVVTVSALFVIGAVIPIDSFYDMRVVMSGSMEPAIQTGSVVAYAERDSYEEGDVIVFEGSSNPVPVTHRVVDVEAESDETRYVTQGDANEDPDHRRVREDDVLGAVFLSVPYAGYLVAFLDTQLGFFILVGIPLVLLVISSVRDVLTNVSTNDSTK